MEIFIVVAIAAAVFVWWKWEGVKKLFNKKKGEIEDKIDDLTGKE
jgi:F0F1-type ATP synthase membrane subunit b/b'